MPEESFRTRTSKWDDPLDRVFPRSSLEAAADAAAKVNAVLIAKGKLKPSQLTNQQIARPKVVLPSVANTLLIAEVEINDVPAACRNLLTRGSTQDEISKMCSAAVSTKGRYINPDEPRRYYGDQRSLYLCIQGPTQASIDKAVQKIHEIINISYNRSKMPRFSAPPPGWPGKGPPPLQTNQPPPLMSFSAVPTELLQDKVFVGLDHAPPTFDVKNRILGVGGSYLQHVETETMARVTLRGKGSDYIEANGSEAFEPLHVHIHHPTLAGLQQAKQLAENLVQTVQQDFAQFQLAFVTVPPPSVGPPPQLPGTAPLFALPPPMQHQNAPPGGNISLLAPPQSPQAAAFITSMTPSPQGLTVLGQQSQPEILSPGAVGLPAAIISNQTVLVNTSVPPPNFLPQQAPSIQSHIIHLGNDPSQGPQPGGLALAQPQVILQPGVTLQPGAQQITLQPGAPPPISQPTVLLQQQPPPQQHVMVSLPQQATPPAGQLWHPGQPPPQGLTTTSIAPQGWVQTSPQGQVLQVVHQLGPPGVVASPVLSTPPPSQQQQQFYPMLINQQVPPPSIQLTPGGQIVAPPPMLQPLPESSSSGQQPPQALGLPPQALGQSPQALPPQYNPAQAYNIQYVSTASMPPSVSPSLTTAPTSGSPTPAHNAPTLPQKRRFTEEKPPMADTENLLGYQHGPLHLMSTVSAPPPAASSPSTVLPHTSVAPSQLAMSHPSQPPPSGAPTTSVSSPGQPLNFDMMAPPPPPPVSEESRLLVKQEVSHDDSKSGMMAMSMPPLPPPLAGGVQQQVNDLDKKLMPPPPPPPTGQDRGQPDRKKIKGAIGNTTGYGGEEDDEMKAILQQQQETAAYSFNQYSSKPQIYLDQPIAAPDPTVQYSVPGPPQSYDQQVTIMQPPPATQGVPAQNGGLPPQMVVYQDANGVTRQAEIEQPVSIQGYDVNAPPSYFNPATGQPMSAPQTLEGAPPTSYIAQGAPVAPVPPPPPPGPPPQQQQQTFWELHQQQLQQQQLSVQQPGWSGDQKPVQSPLQQQGIPQNIGQFGQPPPPPPPQTTPYYQSQQYLPQY